MALIEDTVVDHYESGEVDFGTVHARVGLGPTVDGIISNMVAAEMGSGKFVAMTIVGHSDRFDEPGFTPEQRRARELTASTDRAKNAMDFLFGRVQTQLQIAGATIPVDRSAMVNCSMAMVFAGAANLVHTNPGNDMNQRRENRRVELIVLQLPL